MNEPDLELLRARRPEWEPTDATEERHRQELIAAIAAGSPHLYKRRRAARLPVFLAACVVVATVAATFTVLNAEKRDRVSTIAPQDTIPSDREQSATIVPASQLQCGDTLPFTLDLPSRYGLAQTGPASESRSRPRDEQLVQHWVAERSMVELRWPVDVAIQRQLDANQKSGWSGNPLGVGWGGTTAAGQAWKLITPRAAVDTTPGCETVQLTVYEDTEDKALDASLALLQAFNRTLRPLVRETRTVNALPDVVPCAAPDNVPHVATKQALVSMPPQPTPQEAMRYFRRELAPPGQPGSDLTELTLPDGAVGGYASPLQTGQGSFSPDKFVLVVSLARSVDGWRVTLWRSSGC